MKPLKCRHKGCKNTHKSMTGYCAEHVEDAAHRRRVPVMEGRRFPAPHLDDLDRRNDE